MSTIAASETTLGLNFKTDGDTKEPWCFYQRLDTGCANGQVSGMMRAAPLTVSFPDFSAWVSRVNVWTGEIRTGLSLLVDPLADLSVELTSGVISTPQGLSYKLEMATLDINISWDRAANTVTIEPFEAYTLTFEGFLYAVRTWEELVLAITREF